MSVIITPTDLDEAIRLEMDGHAPIQHGEPCDICKAFADAMVSSASTVGIIEEFAAEGARCNSIQLYISLLGAFHRGIMLGAKAQELATNRNKEDLEGWWEFQDKG